jgi:hypothetical protein
VDLGDRDFREQVESLYWISVEIAALHEPPAVYDCALSRCLELTSSQFGFIALVSRNREHLDMVAVKGFEPAPGFYDNYRVMPLSTATRCGWVSPPGIRLYAPFSASRCGWDPR